MSMKAYLSYHRGQYPEKYENKSDDGGDVDAHTLTNCWLMQKRLSHKTKNERRTKDN